MKKKRLHLAKKTSKMSFIEAGFQERVKFKYLGISRENNTLKSVSSLYLQVQHRLKIK